MRVLRVNENPKNISFVKTSITELPQNPATEIITAENKTLARNRAWRPILKLLHHYEYSDTLKLLLLSVELNGRSSLIILFSHGAEHMREHCGMKSGCKGSEYEAVMDWRLTTQRSSSSCPQHCLLLYFICRALGKTKYLRIANENFYFWRSLSKKVTIWKQKARSEL